MTWIVLLALALNPQPDVACDEVDLLEVNHFHDADGRLVFDQVIFWSFDWEQSRYEVQAWRLLKTQSQVPINGVAIWHDGDTLRLLPVKINGKGSK